MPIVSHDDAPYSAPARWVRVVHWVADRAVDASYLLGDLAEWLRDRAPLPPEPPLRLSAFDKRLITRHRAEDAG